MLMQEHRPGVWNPIEGRGGKGGGKKFREDPNSLKSRGIARILDLIGEGEIRGLVNGSKSIFLDETPIENQDGTLNFQGVSWSAVYGLPDQPHIPGFSNVESPLAGFGGVDLRRSTGAITRRISDLDADAVRVTLQVPALNLSDEDGARLTGTTVQMRIMLAQKANGPSPVYKQVAIATISGKTTSPYEQDYRVDLEGEGPWDLRVERVTADSEDVKLVNETKWSRCALIYDHKFSYPHSALIGLEVNAEYFGSTLPKRAYEVYGLIIRVPSNYDPVTRTYTGLWDGTFKMAWTNNPAWVFYDLVTNERYGLGIAPAYVDKWTLYTVAQYCDELVPDGYGNMEPRFTFNAVISKAEQAHKVLQSLASAFRGMVYWSAGSVMVTQDRPDDPVKIFTPANVIGDFDYSGTSKHARHTVAVVAWNNPELNYEIDYEVVEDTAGIARHGMRSMDMTAFGCTSRGQARREGRWVLSTENLETDSVRFKVGLDGTDVVPGNLIAVADPSYAGVRMGGRLLAVSYNHVTLDAPFMFKAGERYELSVMSEGGEIITRDVGNAAGLSDIVQLVAPLPTDADGDGKAPGVGSIYTLSEIGNVEPRPFRVISVSDADTGQHEIFAVEHQPLKYGIVDEDQPFDEADRNKFDALPRANRCLPPRGPLTATLVQRPRQFGLKPVMLVDWQPSEDQLLQGYVVSYRFGEDNWVTLPMDSNSSVEIDDPDIAQYQIRVMAVNIFGHPSPILTLTKDLGEIGEASLAQPISNIQSANGTTNFGGQDVEITWNSAPISQPNAVNLDYRDVFFNGFEVRVFKRPPGASSSWTPPKTDGRINMVPVRIETVQENKYAYTIEKNLEDGLSREFWVEVCVLSSGGSSDQGGTVLPGSRSKPSSARFYNAPPALQTAEIVCQPYHLQISISPPTDIDYVGNAVWVGEQENFAINDTSLRWRSPGNPLVTVNPGSTVWVRYALYDAFGMTDLLMSEPHRIDIPDVQVTEIDGRPVGDLSGAIDAINDFGQIADQITDEYEALRQSVLQTSRDLQAVSNTAVQNALSITNANAERDRLTHIAGVEIGSIVERERIRTNTLVQDINLLGVKAQNGQSFIMSMDTVRVLPNMTFAEKFTGITAEINNAVSGIEDRAIAHTNALAATVATTYKTNASFNNYQAATANTLSSVANSISSLVEFQNLLGVKNTGGSAVILDTSKVNINASTSLASRLTSIENRFGGTASSSLLTSINSAASNAQSALDTLTQMGATLNNGSAYQLDASKVKVTGSEVLSTRLTNIAASLSAKLDQPAVDARVTQGISASIGANGAIAQWASGAYTSKGDFNATAGVLTESINGVKARAGLYVDSNGRIGGVTIGVQQTRMDMEFVSNNFFFVDANGANKVSVLSYVAGQGWTFNSNTTFTGRLNVKSSSSGRRLQITNEMVQVFDATRERVRLGIWDE